MTPKQSKKPRHASQYTRAEQIGYRLKRASQILIVLMVSMTIFLGLKQIRRDPTMGTALVICGVAGAVSTGVLAKSDRA